MTDSGRTLSLAPATTCPRSASSHAASPGRSSTRPVNSQGRESGRGLPLAPQLPEVPQVSLHLCGVPRDPRQSRPWGRGHHQHWRDGVHLRPSQGLQQDIPCDRAPGGGAAGTAQSTGSRLRTTKALARPPSPSRGSKPDQETRKWNSYLTKVGSCVSGLAKLVEGGTTILKLNTMQIRFVLDFLIFYSLVIFFRSWVPFWLSS